MPLAIAIAKGMLGTAMSATAAELTTGDRDFLRDAAQGASYELAIAQLATQRTTDPAVKSYAHHVVTDHEQLNNQLRQVAQGNNTQLPSGMTAHDQAGLKRLQALNGASFDRAFVQEANRVNDKDKRGLQKEAGTTADQQDKSFVQQMQATNRKHEQQAQALRAGG